MLSLLCCPPIESKTLLFSLSMEINPILTQRIVKAVIFGLAFLLSIFNLLRAFVSCRKRKNLHLRLLLAGTVLWTIEVILEFVRLCFLLAESTDSMEKSPTYQMIQSIGFIFLYRAGIQYLVHLLYSLAILFRLKLLLSILPFEERTVNILILMSIIILSVPTLVIFPYRMLTCPIRAFGQSAVDSRECDNRLFRVLSQIIRGTGYTSFAQVSILLYWTYL